MWCVRHLPQPDSNARVQAWKAFPLVACSALPKPNHIANVGEHLPTSSGKTGEFVQILGYLEAAFLMKDN